MMPFVELIDLDRCRENAGVFVMRGGRELAVFRLTEPLDRTNSTGASDPTGASGPTGKIDAKGEINPEARIQTQDEVAAKGVDDHNRGPAGEQVFVIDNACPHAGGNLSGSPVEGRVVSCRYHQWAFDLATGLCTHSKRARVRTYRVEVRHGAIWADLPEEAS